MTEFASGEGEGPYDDEAGNVGYRRHREHLDEERLCYLDVCRAACFADVSLALPCPNRCGAT
jgi:hypothetical protein